MAEPDGFDVLKADSGSEMGVEEPETPRISAMAVDEVAASLFDFRKRARWLLWLFGHQSIAFIIL